MREIIELAPLMEIVSHEHGKICLKFSPQVRLRIQEKKLAGLTSAVPGIIRSSVRILSRQVVILYDPEIFPASLWTDLSSLRRDPSRSELVLQRLLDQVSG